MGVCLSKCGATHKKAAVVAASISHRVSPTSTTELRRSDHSLKTIFHIQDSIDIKEELLCTTTSSPRVSFEDCLGIPHSSELFSLPDEDVNRSSSLSPPQRRPSSTKFIVTKPTVSIRDISEIPPNGDAQRPRGSFASTATGDPHELIDALHQPGEKSVINSASPPAGLHDEKSMPKGAATHDFHHAEETGNSDFIIRHSPLPRSHDDATGEIESSTRDCASSLVTLRNCREFEAPVEEADSAARTPSSVHELMPFDNSVTIFLKEMENLVSMIQSPKRVIQGQAMKDQGKDFFHGFEHLAKSKEESPRLIPEAKLEGGGADDKVQYTKFEATFTDSSLRGAKCFAETFQFCSQRTFEASEAHKGPGKTKKAKGHTGRSALADINPNIIHVKHAAPAQQKSSSMKAKFPKGLRRGISRSLDSCEVSVNQVNFETLERDQGSLENLTHGVLHKTEIPVMNTVTEDEVCLDDRARLSSAGTKGELDELEPSDKVTVDGMKGKNSMEFEVSNESSELIIDARGPSLPSGIAVPSIPISAPVSQMLMQPQHYLDSEASSYPTPAGVLLSPFDLQNLQNWEPQQPDQDFSGTARCQGQELLAEPRTPVAKKPLSNWRVLCGEVDDPTPIRGIDAGLNEDSKKFLSKALESVLKLVHSPDVERTRFLDKLLEFLTAESEDQETPHRQDMIKTRTMSTEAHGYKILGPHT